MTYNKRVTGDLCLPRFEIRAVFSPAAHHEGINEGKSILSQLIGFLPDRDFRRCVARYGGDRDTKTLGCFNRHNFDYSPNRGHFPLDGILAKLSST